MTELIDLIHKILTKHTDPLTKSPELILLGYCSNETASEHLSRYLLASKFAHGVVLDVASGTCYGSSILKRADDVNIVVSVDIDLDLLTFGRMVYNADCVCADATYLPFRKQAFNCVVSLETLEHIRDQRVFLDNIKGSLKKGGRLILSTPNKLYASPFLPKPLNPFHVKEFYLGPLLNFLGQYGFRVDCIYGGRRVRRLELLRRIFGSILKFFLSKFSLKSYLLDDFYRSIFNLMLVRRCKRSGGRRLIDPDPSLFIHEKLESRSNIVLYQYFLIYAHL
jgi:SAM-dependent methyltransferase